jgi:magnesium chelatase family protein
MGACLTGAGAELVGVEARFDTRERERIEVVLTGLPDSVLKESRSRLECALAACGLHLPQGRLWLNLVPASRRKSGESLDLPLAVAAAAATGHLPASAVRKVLFLGELGIDGTLHAVPGGLAAALAAKELGIEDLVAPPATAIEAAAVHGITAYGARSLAAAIAHVTGVRCLKPLSATEAGPAVRASGPSLDEVRGLDDAKWALAVAAAGGHGVLFVGPPGAGKSLLARRLVNLLPPPDMHERLELTRVLSANGRWPGGLAKERPFRAPHHSTSCAGLVGGGPQALAGEVTLAHGGVLFLDELPEFRRDALEALRQPLESGVVQLSRARTRVELPARFQLIAAMNPCPCGWRGHRKVPCLCSPHAVARYRSKISGPLLDRIDVCVEVQPPEFDELVPQERTQGTNECAPSSTTHTELQLCARVDVARLQAQSRQGHTPNARLSPGELELTTPLCERSRDLLRRAAKARALSARGIQSLRRVARTLADLAGRERVEPQDLAAALALRGSL